MEKKNYIDWCLKIPGSHISGRNVRRGSHYTDGPVFLSFFLVLNALDYFKYSSFIHQVSYSALIFQGSSVLPGPDPIDNRDRTISLILPVVMDSSPIGRNFGDVLRQPPSTVPRGSLVITNFVSIPLQISFLTRFIPWTFLKCDNNFNFSPFDLGFSAFRWNMVFFNRFSNFRVYLHPTNSAFSPKQWDPYEI